jgi:hypothetical protein
MGMKIPEMNMRGKRISVDNIMTFEGTLPAGAERRTPKAAKQMLPRIKRIGRANRIPTGKDRGRNAIPAISTMELIRIPNNVPARASPRTSVGMLTGKVSNLSNVPDCFSHGMIRGPTEEAVKNIVMARKPGKYLAISNCLPIKNAKKRNVGRIRPKINTGAFL